MSNAISPTVQILAPRALTAVNVLLGATLAALTPHANADEAGETMLESIRGGWSTFVFVSTEMPHGALVDLALEASRTHAKLVLRGFPRPSTAGAPLDLQGVGAFVAKVNADCCKDKGPSWLIDPRLYDRYAVRGVPSFVIAWGESAAPQEFSQVAGDMSLATALKYLAQESHVPAVRSQASAVYTRGFGGQP